MWQYHGLYHKALTSFIEKYKEAARDLEKLIREEKQDEAFRLAHNLKGLAGTLALPRLQITAGLLDGALRKGPVDPEDPGMVTLRIDLEEAVEAIQAYLKDNNPPKDRIQQEPQ